MNSTYIALVKAMQAEYPPMETLTPEEARANQLERRRRMVAAATADAATVGSSTTDTSTATISVEDREIPGPNGMIRVRIYRPNIPTPLPVVLYLHGGGWVLCDLDSHDAVCRSLSENSACIFVSVEYRLAPEYKFPTPLEDAFAATVWVAAHREELGAGGKPLAVAGDSAGANLAAAACLKARDEGGPEIALQVLIYPVTVFDFTSSSYQEFRDAPVLTRAAMQWFWGHYLAKADDGTDYLASPLLASDLSGLPDALCITAEMDPLRDEGEAYAHQLREAGVTVRLSRYQGMFHGFFAMTQIAEEARQANEEVASVLKSVLDGAPMEAK